MHLEFLVEEKSAEAALNQLIPKILGNDVAFAIHPFNGKKDLLNKLDSRLRSYSKWISKECKIIILVDQDQDSCIELKRKLEIGCQRANLITKFGCLTDRHFQVFVLQ